MARCSFMSDKIKFFLLGALLTITIFLLTGAKEPSAPKFGRYQVSAWGTNFGDVSGAYGAFITDTATGETKIAYRYVFGTSEKTSIITNNLGKHFATIE